jgi:hypothetical protein
MGTAFGEILPDSESFLPVRDITGILRRGDDAFAH